MSPMFRNHGAAVLARLVPKPSLANADPRPAEAVADYDAEDPYLARVTAEGEPTFKHRPYTAPNLTNDEAVQAVLRLAEQLGVLDRIEILP